MQRTYKCKNNHKFKKEETDNVVLCPVCNEPAEAVKWNNVGEFSNSSKGFGLKEAFGSVVSDIKNGLK